MSDNKYLRWLKDNAGKYQIIPDGSVWTKRDGSKHRNFFSMSYREMNIGFTADIGLEGCIDFFLAMEEQGEL